MPTCLNAARNGISSANFQSHTTSPTQIAAPPGEDIAGDDWSVVDSDTDEAIPLDGDDITFKDTAYPGEHFPETRQRMLSKAELDEWEFKKVRYAINEIFARKGAQFKTDMIRKQFEKMEWYQPVPGRTPQSMTGLLSNIEKHNLKLLADQRATLVKLGQNN